MKNIVKLSNTFEPITLRRRVQIKLKSFFSNICLSYDEYFRNKIRVSLFLQGVFQPEFYITLPPSWRIGTIRLLDDYYIGIKYEGRDVRIIAKVVDSLNYTETNVIIPVNPPFISRVDGGRREYKIVPTEDGLKQYQSILHYPNILKGVRIEYLAQVSNTMSLFSLIPWIFIILSVVCIFNLLINPSVQSTNITLCVSIVVMYLSYIYSYMTIKGKGHDIPHRRIYWIALACITFYVAISLGIASGGMDTSIISQNISDCVSFIT